MRVWLISVLVAALLGSTPVVATLHATALQPPASGTIGLPTAAPDLTSVHEQPTRWVALRVAHDAAPGLLLSTAAITPPHADWRAHVGAAVAPDRLLRQQCAARRRTAPEDPPS